MIEVSCALIVSNGKVLATQRSGKMPQPYKWEFPGGKIEAGETAEHALIREVKEELGLEIRIQGPLAPNVHDYGTKVIRLIPFVCSIRGGTLHLLEHQDFKWLSPHELMNLDWAEADVPIVAQFARRYA